MRNYCLYALLAYLIKFSHFLSTCISCVDCPMQWTNNRKHPNTYICILECFPCVLQWFITDSMSMKNPKKTRTQVIAVFLKMFQVKEQWACLDSFCSFCGKMSFFEKDKRWATFHISIWNLNDRQLKHICYVMQ